MTLKFQPPPELGRYAVFVDNETRYATRPNFQIYSQLGDAKNGYHARRHNGNVKILENVDGSWFVLFDVPKGTHYQNLPWVKEVKYRRSDWSPRHQARPMNRDEYAAWRLAVYQEQQQESVAGLFNLPAPLRTRTPEGNNVRQLHPST